MTRAQWLETLRWTLRKWPRGSDRRGVLENIHHWFNERFTIAGKTLCGLWMASLVLAMFPGHNLGEIFLVIFSSLLLVALFWSWRPVKVRLQCVAQSSVAEGQILSISVGIESLSVKSRAGMHCEFFRLPDAWVPDPKESQTEILDGHAHASLELTAHQRGLWKLPLPTVLCTEPLGIARAPCRIAGTLNVSVYPRPMRILSLPEVPRRTRRGHHAGMQESRPDGDVVGVRPWRDGDRLRDLSHRAWARFGKPHVHEREAAGLGMRSVVLETGCLHWAERQRIEPLIRMAAGILLWLEEREQLDQLVIDQTKIVLPRSAKSTVILDVLSAIPVAAWGRWRKPQSLENIATGSSPVLAMSVCDSFIQQELQNQNFPEHWECLLLAGSSGVVMPDHRVRILGPESWNAAELSL